LHDTVIILLLLLVRPAVSGAAKRDQRSCCRHRMMVRNDPNVIFSTFPAATKAGRLLFRGEAHR